MSEVLFIELKHFGSLVGPNNSMCQFSNLCKLGEMVS